MAAVFRYVSPLFGLSLGMGPLLLACAGLDGTATNTLPNPTETPSPAPKGASPKVANEPPIVAQTRELCSPDCRLLTTYRFETVQQNFCKLCGAHSEWACEMDWPTNDVPSCDIWDQYRNCIYATYGRPFDTPKWKEYFAQQPWYAADASYSDARLSPMAKENVDKLKRFKAEKYICMD